MLQASFRGGIRGFSSGQVPAGANLDPVFAIGGDFFNYLSFFISLLLYIILFRLEFIITLFSLLVLYILHCLVVSIRFCHIL